MSEAPRAVREAALAAFEARRPGAQVLDLERDLPVTSVVGDPACRPYRELRFGQTRAPVVTVVVKDCDDALILTVLVEPGGVHEQRLEVSNINGPSSPALHGMPPFQVTGVLHGLTSLILSIGPAGSPDEQRWQTAWVRL